jgi:protein-disulfide isomerase
MNKSYKQLIFILVIAVALTAAILARQLVISKKISVEKSERPLVEESSTMIPIDVNDPILGNQGAPMTIVEFADLNSAEGRLIHKKIARFVESHPAQLRLIYKDFPQIGFFTSTDNLRPHQAAFCAYKQDKKKFWTFLESLISAGNNIDEDKTIYGAAEQLKLNTSTLKICLDSAEAKTRVEASISLAKYLGLTQAPGIFVNNRRLNYVTEIDLDAFLAELIKTY